MLLVDANGTTYKPDYDAMNIRPATQDRHRPGRGAAGDGPLVRPAAESIVQALRVGEIGKDIALPGT
jgi:hypothetical protein